MGKEVIATQSRLAGESAKQTLDFYKYKNHKGRGRFILEHKTQRDEMLDAAYESYAEDIYRVCLHLTGNEKDAQDIAQQTFLNFYGRSENVDSDCTFEYLVCAAKNLARRHQNNLGQRR